MLTLAITGFDADPARVTDVIGIEPTSTGKVGERSQSGKPRTFNGWWYDVELQRLVDGGQHADALARMLDQLRGRERQFAQLRETLGPREITIYGGLYVTGDRQCGVHLESLQMQVLADCGIGWGLDIFAD